MDHCKEAISLRNARLFNSVLTQSGPMQRSTRMKMSQDALLDAFILLYDECYKDTLKKDINMCHFVNKYRTLVSEIKSLRVNLSDFEMKTVIGRGHFGEVRVVREKQTGDVYAMKILKKAKTVNNHSAALFEEEHDIMCSATSPWLTALQYSFQDNENLYFVMEYHPGGDLLSLLDRNNNTLSPDMAKFYIAETALAVRALHQMGYVHRDIKPDNILLDRCGHVKLVDFGSAAKLSASGFVTTSMPVGTPEYIAPEILVSLNEISGDRNKKQCYGTECDYWSLGILAYEMVVGRTPFSGLQLTSTYFNIMNHKKKLKYPENLIVPDPLKDLIEKLLEDPSVRLKHEGLIKHPFFCDIDWNNIRNEAPPFVPSISSSDDTSNFIDFEKKKSAPYGDFKENKREFSGKNLPFIGFTFSQNPPDNSCKDSKSSEEAMEKKKAGLEAVLAVTRRENQQLISKLYEAQFGRNGEHENMEKRLEEKTRLLELCETERDKLQREVAKAQAENSTLRRTLELDRKDRKEMEANALNLIRQNKVKLERDVSNKISQLNAKIEELNDKLTESHTVNNELASKCDRAETELAAARNEIEKWKGLESAYKSKMAKAREFKRQSVVGLESRLEQIAQNQTNANELQQKLNDETCAKLSLIDQIKEIELAWTNKEAQFQREIKDYEDKIAKLEDKISAQHMEIASLQVKLDEKPNVIMLEKKLEAEKNECIRLRTKITNIETELSNTTQSFTDHESAIAAHEESVSLLEKELRTVSDEKIKLQKKLQKTKETEEENRQKLSYLEVVVDRLEQGVLKLEAENLKLKQQQSVGTTPLLSEAETRYQEKITILEDQAAKLENQVQKLTEKLVLEKESLKNTQTTLWKTEKELADAKIDIRIAKREAKTSDDLIKKLQEELRKATEKMTDAQTKVNEEIVAEREKIEKLSEELSDLKTELAQRELEVKYMKNQLNDHEELKLSEKQLKKDYNEICQQLKFLEKQTGTLREEKDRAKQSYQALEMEKMKIEATVEELKHKICGLELNNNVLKETETMLDEQLEDYEKFATSQAEKIEQMSKEKSELEKELEAVKAELRTCRQNLNEEKSLKIRAEQRVSFLENELTDKKENASELQKEITRLNNVIEELKQQVIEYEERTTSDEIALNEWSRRYEALAVECQWLKQEATNHLTNVYSLKESNYKLTHDLEEERGFVDALQERIVSLENVITELEAFHKQREVKDEATKQQQNKLISFLQAKLDDSKKKKTFTDMLFGSRTKENVPPPSPAITSPPSGKNSETLPRHKSSKDLINSPATKQALSQLVKSPSSQNYFQRQTSLQRMHHNIPHRFKNQLVIRVGKCSGCHGGITRGSQCSICTHCDIQAHPKCALTIPKTCGLPAGFAKHYTKSVVAPEKSTPMKTDSSQTVVRHEGWVKIPKSGKTCWEKKYARLEGSHFMIYEHEPKNSLLEPIHKWNLSPEGGHVLVGETADCVDLPSTAKSDLPYIIKIAIIPKTTCWPQETHYVMVLTPSEKPAWLAALSAVVSSDNMSEEREKYSGTTLYTLDKDASLSPNCCVQVNEKLLIVGTKEGLYSMKPYAENPDPVKITGVGEVHQIALAPNVGSALMIVEDSRTLVGCDHRALISNAEAAACSSPSITVTQVDLGSAVECCLMFSVSQSINGTVYLTAATATRVVFLKWCHKNSQFLVIRVLETHHPCSCVIYTSDSVIVGCDKFYRIDLKDFTTQEFLDPSVKSMAFWKLDSFPIQIIDIGNCEYLLCFNEFGLFVNHKGVRTQSDLKWSRVPCEFVYSPPYLFVFHMSSLEVIKLPRPEVKSSEDSVCTSSTATIRDTPQISLSNPRFLGRSKIPSSVLITANGDSNLLDIILVEGNKLYKDNLGSCLSLTSIETDDTNRCNDKDMDEFSFTSSLVHSLEEVGCSTPRLSDESDSCVTYTIAAIHDNKETDKRVKFTPKTAF